jgi:PadR family transcriptional regulator PadR
MPRGGGHGRRRGRRNRRGARLIEPVLLLQLHQGLSHGYALLDQLREYGLGHVDPSAVYRALREMEDREWVTSVWDEEETQGPPRRVYQITERGDEALANWIKDLEQTRAHIDHVLETYVTHMAEHRASEE